MASRTPHSAAPRLARAPIRSGVSRTSKRSLLWFLAFGGVLAFFVLIVIVGPSVILPTQQNDANTIASLAEDITDQTELAGSFILMAYIYSFTTPVTRALLILAVGVTYLTLLFKNARTVYSIGITSFLSLAPIIVYMALFNKETINCMIIILTYLFISKIKNRYLSLGIIVVIYSLYAMYFRQYYFIIIVVLFMILILRWYQPQRGGMLGLFVKMAVILGGFIVLLLAPDGLLNRLQESRDVINAYRIYNNISGNRTAFFNYLPADGIYTFFQNYIYAFVRLNFPFLFSVSFSEMFLFVNISIYTYVLVATRHVRDPRLVLLSSLFMAHIAVLILFEPDLGTYLRHAATPLLYLAPHLALIGVKRGAGRAPTGTSRRARAAPITGYAAPGGAPSRG